MNTTLILAAPVSLSVAAAIAALLSFGKIKKTLHSQLHGYEIWDKLQKETNLLRVKNEILIEILWQSQN